MEHLISQETFEVLIGKQPSEKPVPGFVIIWFSAKWCGPCRRLNEEMLLEMNPQAKWYKCDIDENTYTPGYCGIRSIPTFLAILDQKPVGTFQSSDTHAVTQWVQGLLNNYSK